MNTACRYLEALAARRRFGVRQGLEVMAALAARLGHPEAGLAPVHIAGTNGKGSVAAMTDAVLRAAGLPCGRYTSPHLLRFNERIFVRGAAVADAALDAAVAAVEAAAAAVVAAGADEPTFFECATAAAFEVYRREGIRLVALETGLGGRLDATNVVAPLVSVITRIGLEHTQWLGDTVAAIAAEKAGIIKPGRRWSARHARERARWCCAGADLGWRVTDAPKRCRSRGPRAARGAGGSGLDPVARAGKDHAAARRPLPGGEPRDGGGGARSGRGSPRPAPSRRGVPRRAGRRLLAGPFPARVARAAGDRRRRAQPRLRGGPAGGVEEIGTERAAGAGGRVLRRQGRRRLPEDCRAAFRARLGRGGAVAAGDVRRDGLRAHARRRAGGGAGGNRRGARRGAAWASAEVGGWCAARFPGGRRAGRLGAFPWPGPAARRSDERCSVRAPRTGACKGQQFYL